MGKLLVALHLGEVGGIRYCHGVESGLQQDRTMEYKRSMREFKVLGEVGIATRTGCEPSFTSLVYRMSASCFFAHSVRTDLVGSLQS